MFDCACELLEFVICASSAVLSVGPNVSKTYSSPKLVPKRNFEIKSSSFYQKCLYSAFTVPYSSSAT